MGGGVIRTFHDHRIAMAFAIAALRAERELRCSTAIMWPPLSRFRCAGRVVWVCKFDAGG